MTWRKFFKDNYHLFFLVGMMVLCLTAVIYGGGKHDGIYFLSGTILFIVFLVSFTVVSHKKKAIQAKDIESVKVRYIKHRLPQGNVTIKFFVPYVSPFQFVRLYRKMKGIHVLLFYRAIEEDTEIDSCVKFYLTDKDLFEAKLKGYFNTSNIDFSFEAKNDPWLEARMKIK